MKVVKVASCGWGYSAIEASERFCDLFLVAEGEGEAELGQKLLGWQSKL